jgi:acyl-CoA synthetase (AMP-forming)/AMP-acid ligase II
MRAQGLGWNDADRVLCVLPLFHVNALCHTCLAMLSVGGSIVLTDKFSASRFWDEVRAHDVTTSSLMRTIPQILLASPEKPGDSENPLRYVVTLLRRREHALRRAIRRQAVPSLQSDGRLAERYRSRNLPREIRRLRLPLAPEFTGSDRR